MEYVTGALAGALVLIVMWIGEWWQAKRTGRAASSTKAIPEPKPAPVYYYCESCGARLKADNPTCTDLAACLERQRINYAKQHPTPEQAAEQARIIQEWRKFMSDSEADQSNWLESLGPF